MGGNVIGGGFAGVASKLEQEGIKSYNEHKAYNEWEFVYDISKDPARGAAGAIPPGAPPPGTPVGAQPNSPGAFPNGFPSGSQSGSPSGAGPASPPTFPPIASPGTN